MSTAFHFIAVMSHYSRGTRVGWHYSSFDRLDKELVNTFFEKVKRTCGDVQFGIHKLSTDSTSWESVVEKDQFFDDVFVTSDMDTFINFVSSDQELSAHDVAKFLLTVLPSSHLKLQKLLYYCYTECLKRTGKQLFKEPIVAYKLGPVVESVFRKFTVHGSSTIELKEDEDFVITTEKIAATPSFIKVATSELGFVAMDCIIDTLKKYGQLSPYELVDKTHQAGGPWDRVFEPGRNSVITDELIMKFHNYAE